MLAPMSRPALALLVALVAATGCGDDPVGGATPDADVRGTSLRKDATASVVDGASPLGDLEPAAGPSDPSPLVQPPPRQAASDDHETVTWEELAGFDFAPYLSDPNAKNEVPAKIRALSGKRVAIDGYMMPLSYEAGGARKFLLMKDQYGCCYAVTPKVNEWIEVTMEGGAVADYIHLQLVTVWGVLEVKQESHDGMATGLYKMKGARTEFTDAK
jgi:hypothetical protein